MKVPLKVSVVKDRLGLYRNGKFELVDLPFNPFMLCQADRYSMLNTKVEKWTKLPENIETEYKKATFSAISYYDTFKHSNFDNQQYLYYNNYLEQLYITKPDFLLDYPNDKPIRVMYYDIEVQTVGDKVWPKASKRPMLSVGYSIWLFKEDGTLEREGDRVIIDKFTDTLQDKEILEDTVKVIEDGDPDIIAGYNSEQFDTLYLLERCGLQGIDVNRLCGGTHSTPWVDDNGGIHLGRRIHYDIYKKVVRDQSLFGLKSKNLKEVARKYKVPLSMDTDIELELDNTMKIFNEDKERFLRYQDADIVRTEHVGPVYIWTDITLAEMLHVPLDSVMNMYPSFVPKIYHGRKMWESKLINTRSNFSKYNSVTGHIHKFRKWDNKELKFQAAINGIYRDRYFPCVYKLDFSSQYPSTAMTFNLGPDTTFFVKTLPYTGHYRFSIDEKYRWYEIPDSNFGVNLLIKVRHDKTGFLKEGLSALGVQRSAVKKEMKKASSEQYNRLYSQQLALKVISNSMFGFQSVKSSIYGDMMSGLMIAAMSRWCITKVIHQVTDSLVEVDTDAIITNKKIEEKAINNYLDSLMKKTFGIKDNYMKMESEDSGEAYFCKKKTYVIIEDGISTIHGSALKSSRIPPIVDRARNLAIEHVFNNKPVEEVVREAYNFSNCLLEDFTYSVRLTRKAEEYSDPGGQIPFLVAQVEKKTKKKCEAGTRIEYVVAKNILNEPSLSKFIKLREHKENYTYIEYIDSINKISRDYYNKQIDKMLAMFGISKIVQHDLFEEQPDLLPERLLDKLPVV